MLHSAVIRTTVLIQHYCVALMAVSGRISDSEQLHKHTSVETLEITQSLITAAQHCPSRHGHMVLLRIPSPALADWAFRQLGRVRGQLGLEHTFEIILGDPNQPLRVGQSFVEQIKVLVYRRRCSGPRTGPTGSNQNKSALSEMAEHPGGRLGSTNLPGAGGASLHLDPVGGRAAGRIAAQVICVVLTSVAGIIVGLNPGSAHRSLKHCDLRVISSSHLQRTTLEQELGLAAYLVRAEPRPLHNPSPGSDTLESDAEKLSSTDNEEEEEQSGEMRPVPDQTDVFLSSHVSVSLVLSPEDSPVSSSQQLQPCPGAAAADPLLPSTPDVLKGAGDASPPAQPSFPSVPHPAPHLQTSSQGQTVSQQNQNQSSCPPLQLPRSSFLPPASSPHQSCSWARGVSRPPSLLLPRTLYNVITASDSSGLPRCTSFLPHMSVAWASSFR